MNHESSFTPLEVAGQFALGLTANALMELLKPREIVNQINIEEAKKSLDDGKSLLVLFNHVTELDLIHLRHVKQELQGHYRELTVVAGAKLLENRVKIKGLNIVTPTLLGLQRVHNFTIIPVRQTNDKQGRENDKDYRAFNDNALRTIATTLLRPNTVVAMSPEGTRTGFALHPAEKGLDRLFKQYKKLRDQVVFLPVTLLGAESLKTPNKVAYGMPYTHKDAVAMIAELKDEGLPFDHASALADLAMTIIGANLPQEQQGYYRAEIAQFTGRNHFSQ